MTYLKVKLWGQENRTARLGIRDQTYLLYVQSQTKQYP